MEKDMNKLFESVSEEFNHLAAILHVYARGRFDFYEVKKNEFSKRKWKYTVDIFTIQMGTKK